MEAANHLLDALLRGPTDNTNGMTPKVTPPVPQPPFFHECCFQPPCHQAGPWISLHSAITVDFTFKITHLPPHAISWYEQLTFRLPARWVGDQVGSCLGFQQCPISHRKSLVFPSSRFSQLQPSRACAASPAPSSAPHPCAWAPTVTSLGRSASSPPQLPVHGTTAPRNRSPSGLFALPIFLAALFPEPGPLHWSVSF